MTARINKKLINLSLILNNSLIKAKNIATLLIFLGFIVNSPVIANDLGRQLYETHCGNCHGLQGEGFRKLYPPINETLYLGENLQVLPCIIRNGLHGEIKVGAQVFNQVMPGNTTLSPDQIRHIIRYMQQTWDHNGSELKVEEWLTNCHK